MRKIKYIAAFSIISLMTAFGAYASPAKADCEGRGFDDIKIKRNDILRPVRFNVFRFDRDDRRDNDRDDRKFFKNDHDRDDRGLFNNKRKY
jgi:hypothetical protein